MREERDGQPGPFATAARGKAASAGVTQKNPAPWRRGENDHPRARVRLSRTCAALAPGDTLRPRCGVVHSRYRKKQRYMQFNILRPKPTIN